MALPLTDTQAILDRYVEPKNTILRSFDIDNVDDKSNKNIRVDPPSWHQCVERMKHSDISPSDKSRVSWSKMAFVKPQSLT